MKLALKRNWVLKSGKIKFFTKFTISYLKTALSLLYQFSSTHSAHCLIKAILDALPSVALPTIHKVPKPGQCFLFIIPAPNTYTPVPLSLSLLPRC